jgi:alanyl aminopeptidase
MELRSSIVPLVAVEGDDKGLQAEARRLALRWLDDRNAIHPDLVTAALSVTGRTLGDQAYLDKLEAAFDRTTDSGDRQRLSGAFGTFQDPGLLFKAFDFALDEKRDIREGSRVFFGAVRGGGEISPDVYEWVKTHFDRLVERMPRQGRGVLLRLGAVLCDEEKLKDYEAFFKERADKVLGGPRIYANTVETIQSCIAIKRAQAPSVQQFFSKNHAR